MTRGFLVPEEPIRSLDAYIAVGGSRGLSVARDAGPEATEAVVRASGLRGRGGGGFPTGIKWAGIREGAAVEKHVVCNAAEGEPGTFKDRWLLRVNPYQVIEGLAIAAFVVGTDSAYVGVKARFGQEIAALERASAEMSAAGWLEDLSVTIVPGPDDYLFGEEKALLEVIEGREPLPRLNPPYVQGLFESGGDAHAALVNNVETLANVPHIVSEGPEWFRSYGTSRSPGTMVFTVGGDVEREAVVELELGTPLSFLAYAIGGGPISGREIKMVTSGVSNSPLPPALLETPMDFDSLREVGSGLGSGGFTVWDDSRCAVAVGAVLSGFLYRGSCGQCPPCKLGTQAITERLGRLSRGASAIEVEEIAAWATRVTDANRCGLGAGQRALAEGLLRMFPEDLAHHARGEPCSGSSEVRPPVIDDWDPTAGTFVYRR